MSDLNHLLLSPESRKQGLTIEEPNESNDYAWILRYNGKEIARTSETGIIVDTIVKIMSQEVSNN